ncbi:MAG: SDR family NAD(P)-dependent oxidoreductase [Reichenbachiella sp.]
MDLKEKVVIVTGSSKGIGFETAKLLLAKGAKVAGWSRSETVIDHENFIHIVADVSDATSVKVAHEKTVAHFGDSIDVLINNAGLGHYGPMTEMPYSQWKEMFAINVDGIYFCSNVVIPGMKEKDAGHIINISSIAGLNPIKNMVGYAATKHAVTGMSHSMFMELRDFGIKVTCIYPGSTNTNFFDSIDAYDANDNMMRPIDIAESIAYCLGTHANYLPVDFEVRPLRPKK